MNRGRRRGGPGLSGLRDGVKRRLFDPHLVPIKPDEKNEINRLLQIDCFKPSCQSRLEDLRKTKGSESAVCDVNASTGRSEKLYKNLFQSKAVFELAFRKGPFYHSVSETPEGIDINRVYGTPEVVEKTRQPTEPVLLAHLLLAHRDLAQWSRDSQFEGLADPDSWYPEELVKFTKPARKVAAKQKVRHKPNLRKRRLPSASADNLTTIIPDQLIEQTIEATEEDDAIGKPDGEQDQDDGDSDDARWNGEVNADADPDELDEDELDNDYCQTYFDNGEGDLSDTGLGGVDDEDDGRSKYYD